MGAAIIIGRSERSSAAYKPLRIRVVGDAADAQSPPMLGDADDLHEDFYKTFAGSIRVAGSVPASLGCVPRWPL